MRYFLFRFELLRKGNFSGRRKEYLIPLTFVWNSLLLTGTNINTVLEEKSELYFSLIENTVYMLSMKI